MWGGGGGVEEGVCGELGEWGGFFVCLCVLGGGGGVRGVWRGGDDVFGGGKGRMG